MTARYFGPENDKIKKVVLLALENRSFDQMLGGMQAVIPEIDGIDPKAPARRNIMPDGTVYEQTAITDKQIKHDPMHEHTNIMVQIGQGNGGFISDFVKAFPQSTPQERQHLMGYYPADFLPALHPLARHFTVCDRWFSPVPGPTWPNRNALLSGTTLGKIRMPDKGKHLDMVFGQTQDTIFDRLNEKNRSWKVYSHDIACSLLLQNQMRKANRARYFDFQQLLEDTKNAATFPEFSFIEPCYYGKDENDDHPPHNIMKGQKLIADIYNAIRKNPELWESTLFIVLYDEHGGFYDHVEPPKCVPPGEYAGAEYTFDQLGVRVPALLISPWVKQGVEHTVFDHTSVLRYLIDKWELRELGNRAAAANSIECALQFDSPITNAPMELVVTKEQLEPQWPEWEEESLTGHNRAQAEAWNRIREQLKGVLLEEAGELVALHARDPKAFKRKVYPVLAGIGEICKMVGLAKFGNWLITLHTDFVHEDVERVGAEIKAAIAIAQAAVPATTVITGAPPAEGDLALPIGTDASISKPEAKK